MRGLESVGSVTPGFLTAILLLRWTKVLHPSSHPANVARLARHISRSSNRTAHRGEQRQHDKAPRTMKFTTNPLLTSTSTAQLTTSHPTVSQEVRSLIKTPPGLTIDLSQKRSARHDFNITHGLERRTSLRPPNLTHLRLPACLPECLGGELPSYPNHQSRLVLRNNQIWSWIVEAFLLLSIGISMDRVWWCEDWVLNGVL